MKKSEMLCAFLKIPCHFETVCVYSVVSLQPHGLKPAQASLSMEFTRQEYWSGLPLPTPGGLPDSGIEPTSPASPALADRLFTTAPPGKLL